MARIVIENLNDRSIPVDDPGKTLLQLIHANNVDFMHACGGKGRCTTCKVVVKAGLGNMNPPTEAETRYARIGALREKERLACQATARGDIVVVIPKENKLPHVSYSD